MLRRKLAKCAIFSAYFYSQNGFPLLMLKPWSLPSLCTSSIFKLYFDIQHLPLRSDPKYVVLQKYLLPNQTCPNQTAQLTWQQTLLDPQSRELENTLDSQMLLKPVQVPTNAKESFFTPRQVKSLISSSLVRAALCRRFRRSAVGHYFWYFSFLFLLFSCFLVPAVAKPQ